MVQEDTTKREIAYEYILKEGCGRKDVLLKKIGQDLFDEFCFVGYIKQGMDGNLNERWKLTNFGRSQTKSYFDFKNKTKEIVNEFNAIQKEVERLIASI